MNKEKILRLADVVEELEHAANGTDSGKFDMSRYAFFCGAPACVAGWAVAIEVADFNVPTAAKLNVRRLYPGDGIVSSTSIHRKAGEILELSPGEAARLFRSSEPTSNLYDITPLEAAWVLRKFAETGEIDWAMTGYEP